MRYIVTGGAGFIGSNLADTLAQNHDVVIIDNLATGRRENIEHLLDHPRVNFIEGSITDLDLLMDTFPGADGIFHQAAIPSVPRSVKDPLASNEANVTGTVKCARRGEGLRGIYHYRYNLKSKYEPGIHELVLIGHILAKIGFLTTFISHMQLQIKPLRQRHPLGIK